MVTGMDEARGIAGHQLVRALRRDAEREAWVAVADGDGVSVGVELHRSLPGAEAALGAEAEALGACEHPHLVPLLDVAADDGVVLVRPLLRRSLADWLVERAAPEPGEAVTVLAPVAAAIGALHARGATAGAPAAAAVRIDDDGAPLVTGEGAAIETDRPTDAWRESSAGVAADVAAWRALAEALLDAAGAELPERASAALERCDLAGAGDALLARWAGLPLQLEAPAPGAAAAVPRRAMRRRERPEGVLARFAERAGTLADAVLGRIGAVRGGALGGVRPGGRDDGRDGGGGSAQTPLAALGRVRPRYWAMAGVGGAAAVAAVVLSGGSGAAPGSAAAPVATDAIVTDAVETAQAPPAAPEPVEPEAAAPDPSADAASDPAAAIAAMLAEREACLDADDAACLVALHDPGSPQLQASEPWRMPADASLELGERLGDAWLVRIASQTAPASALVMSTEAGWTLRDAWQGSGD